MVLTNSFIGDQISELYEPAILSKVCTKIFFTFSSIFQTINVNDTEVNTFSKEFCENCCQCFKVRRKVGVEEPLCFSSVDHWGGLFHWHRPGPAHGKVVGCFRVPLGG